VLPQAKLQPDAQHVFADALRNAGPVTHVRFNIFPDGGVSRLRVWGTPSSEGRLRAGLGRLNALTGRRARAELLTCCGSAKWADQMVARRPFHRLDQLWSRADAVWAGLDSQDWLDAFRSHPRIGERKAEKEQSEQERRWSEQEQSSVSRASEQMRAALAEGNRAYEQRFGYLFIICATGKDSETMLSNLKPRLANHPETELRVAAEEQRRITRLRLEKLVRL
jgi:allantoicase